MNGDTTRSTNLFKALEAIELVHPEWRSDHSPTQRVGLEITENAKQIDHLQPMLSLANSYNEKDLIDFDLQIKKLLKLDVTEEISYSVEPKYDGGGISLVYEDNQLLRAVTRGDGSRGEEITNNVKSMKSVPLYADFAKLGIKTIELRGEALISTANFTKINKLREENGQVLFANARNAATGGLRTKDPKETENRKMDAFIYSISYAADEAGNSKLDDFKSHFASIDIIGSLGVKVPSEARKLCKGIDEVVKFCAKWQNDRNLFPYEIDGMVIKLDNKNWQDRIGFTAHHPRSVALAGVTISSVSLHNEEFIESRDLRLGDMVVVERAGDVIPYIVKALDDVRTGSEIPIKFPTNCPSCNSDLVKLETEAAWRCINPDCPAQNLQRLIFFASKDAMDIDGFGKSIMEKFFELGWVKTYPDIYRLTEEQISGLEGFGARSAEKLIAAIEVSKANPIQRFLHALSIHHVGKKVSKLLAEEIDNVLDLTSWTKEHFEGIKDIGPVVAQNVIAYFGDDANVTMIKEMETLGVNLTATTKDRRAVVTNSDHHLSGKTILFTGTLHQMGRKEAQEKAESLGAKNLGAVSSNLNILVVGDNAGSKLKKAKELGTVEVLTEQEFLDLL